MTQTVRIVGSIAKESANNAINVDSKKRRSFVTPLIDADYGEC